MTDEPKKVGGRAPESAARKAKSKLGWKDGAYIGVVGFALLRLGIVPAVVVVAVVESARWVWKRRHRRQSFSKVENHEAD